MPYISSDSSSALTKKRNVYLGPDDGEIEASVYQGDMLNSGNEITPISIIQETVTALLILPGSKVTVTKYGNYVIDIA